MTGIALLLILVLGVVGVIALVAQRSTSKRDDDSGGGSEIVPYLVLAIAMGVAGFALADLAATAFPEEQFVFDPAEDLATSLSALVVSAPFAVYFWRRQAQRREIHPGVAGWALYLSAIELVFMTAFVVTAILFINGLLTDEPASAWARAVVFGAIVAFHEVAARRKPPASDAGELPRVIGSALSLIAATAGLTGVLAALLASIYEGLTDLSPLDPGFDPWVAMVVVGLPIWSYRWLTPWEERPALPRLTWTVMVVFVALATAVGAATGVLVQIAEYVLTATVPGAEHFEPLPVTLALTLVGLPVWLIHRRELGHAGGNPLQVYRYAMAALGLAASVAMATALTVAAFDRTLLVEPSPSDIVTLAVVLIVGLAVWLTFDRRAVAEDHPDASWPRKLYTLGVGIVFGLVAAGALITTLFVFLRRVLGSPDAGSLIQSTTTLVYTGAAAWYLLGAYFRERTEPEAGTAIAPFEVTLVCSHPGLVAAKFPEQARLQVLYRGDELGVIDEKMAEEIVAAVGKQASIVWVDQEGFRVAPKRGST